MSNSSDSSQQRSSNTGSGLIAVTFGVKVFGVYAPGTPRDVWVAGMRTRQPLTYDWREAPNHPDNTAGIVAESEIGELEEMMNRVYPGDALFVGYIVLDRNGEPWRNAAGMACQPRINKDSLPWLYSQGYTVEMHNAIVDIDTVGHVEWTPETRAETEELIRRCPYSKTWGIYFSKKGWRIVQPIWPIPVAEFEPLMREFIRLLAKWGIIADNKCLDWGHLMTCPKARRVDGTRALAEPDTLAMVAIDFEAMLDEANIAELPPEPDGEPKKRRRDRLRRDPQPGDTKRARGDAGQIIFTTNILPVWNTRANTIGAAIRTEDTINPQGIRELYFPMFNVLLKRGCPPEFLPEIARRIAFQAKSSKVEDKVAIAQDCVARWQSGKPMRGIAWLRENRLSIAQVVWQQTMYGKESRVHADPTDPNSISRVILLPEEARKAMEIVFWNPPMAGVHILKADAGLGKTTSAIHVGIAKARIHFNKETGKYAPQARTILSADKNSLSIQNFNNIAKKDFEAVRLFGPASLRNADGSFVCHYSEAARALSSANLSVHFNLCEGGVKDGSRQCEYAGTCPAYAGLEGDPESPFALCNHRLIHKGEKLLGSGAMLLIDEPPEWLKTVRIPLSFLDLTLKNKSLFSRRYGTALTPLIVAAKVWLDQLAKEETDSQTADWKDMLAAAACTISSDEIDAAIAATGVTATGDVLFDMIAAGREAPDPEHKTKSPPLLRHHAMLLRSKKDHAALIGKVGMVLNTFYEAVSSAARVVCWMDERGDEKAISIMYQDAYLERVLTRPEGCTVMDANGELHLPMIEQIAGKANVKMTTISAGDAMPVIRTHIPWATANKTGWFADGRLKPMAGVVNAVQKAVDYANEQKYPGGGTLTIITFMQVRVALEWALGLSNDIRKKELLEIWKGKDRYLFQLADMLAPILTQWKGKWILGHYFNVRGMNEAENTDVIVTIGDPWTERGSVDRTSDYFHMDRDNRWEQLVAAELYQAQERARTCQRKKTLWALVIGLVLPAGHSWDSGVHVREGESIARSKRAATASEMAAEILAAGLSKAAVARECGWSLSNFQKFFVDPGEPRFRPITTAVLEDVRGAISHLRASSSR